MSTKTDSLREIYLNVADDETVTERKRDGPSHDPIEGDVAELERELEETTRQDGLEEAVADSVQNG